MYAIQAPTNIDSALLSAYLNNDIAGVLYHVLTAESVDAHDNGHIVVTEIPSATTISHVHELTDLLGATLFNLDVSGIGRMFYQQYLHTPTRIVWR